MNTVHPRIPYAPPVGRATAWPALLATLLLWLVSGEPFRAHDEPSHFLGSVVSIAGAIAAGLWASGARSGFRAVLRSTVGVTGTLFAAMFARHESADPAVGCLLGVMLGPLLSVPFVYAASARRSQSAEDFHAAFIVAGGWLMCLGGSFAGEELASSPVHGFSVPLVPASFRLGLALAGGLGLVVAGLVRHHLLLEWLKRIQGSADAAWSITPRADDAPPSLLPRILSSVLHAPGTLSYRWPSEAGPFRDSTAIIPVALVPAPSARHALRTSRLRIHGTVATVLVLAWLLGFLAFALLRFSRWE